MIHYLKNKRQLVSSCLPFRNSHSIIYVLVDLSLTSLPWFCKNSTSCWEKVVMEIDLTLWGGLSPLLKQKQTAWLNTKLGRNIQRVGIYLNTNRRNVWDKRCRTWQGRERDGKLQEPLAATNYKTVKEAGCFPPPSSVCECSCILKSCRNSSGMTPFLC